ncbi:MAG: transglycosylase SLT domain-containing protein [Stellaceae bacterium]
MAGVMPRGRQAAIRADIRFAFVEMRRWTQILLLAATLSGFASAAVATPAGGARPPLAQSEDTVALAERYENGEMVRQDYRAALELYCRAAGRGDPRAFFHLGWMYLNGRGVARSDATAVMWLRKAAGGGVPQAANLLQLLAGVPSSPMRGCQGGGAIGVSLAHAPPAIRALADETALQFGINPQLLLSVMAVESGFNPRAVSPKAAAGLMQLMPQTAARFGVADRFDPRDNLRGGATYLRSLLVMFDGNLTLALAAYNAGEATVLARGAVPPYPETINYVAAVKRLCACGQ